MSATREDLAVALEAIGCPDMARRTRGGADLMHLGWRMVLQKEAALRDGEPVELLRKIDAVVDACRRMGLPLEMPTAGAPRLTYGSSRALG